MRFEPREGLLFAYFRTVLPLNRDLLLRAVLTLGSRQWMETLSVDCGETALI